MLEVLLPARPYQHVQYCGMYVTGLHAVFPEQGLSFDENISGLFLERPTVPRFTIKLLFVDFCFANYRSKPS